MNIQQFWSDVLAQRADKIREYFHADAYVNWHCSNEHFTVEEFIRANCEYPGDWDGEVEKIVTTDDMIITATRVYPKDRSASFHVTSFIKLKDDKIVAMDEYWADDGEAPKWRQDMKILILLQYGYWGHKLNQKRADNSSISNCILSALRLCVWLF